MIIENNNNNLKQIYSMVFFGVFFLKIFFPFKKTIKLKFIFSLFKPFLKKSRTTNIYNFTVIKLIQ